MKKIKFSKSEYVLLFNTIGALTSLALFLIGDIQIIDSNGTKDLSFVFQGYTAVASIWFCIFVPLNSELYNKRWLTKVEKNYTYFAYLFVSALCFVVERYPLENLIIFILISVLWLILKIGGAHTLPEDIDKEEPVCSDPYYFENEAKTLRDFGADISWYSKKKEKQLRSIYVKTAKEFSGKKSKREIELYVRNRVMMAKERGPKTATCIFLIGMGLFMLLMPVLGDNAAIMVFVLSPLQLYGIFGFSKNMHDPLTPWESSDLARRDAVEKSGEPIFDVKESALESLNAYDLPKNNDSPLHQQTSKTRNWSSTRLDVRFSKIRGEKISKLEISKEAQAESNKPDIIMIVLAIGFSLPVVIFLLLAINVGWMFLIGVIIFAIFGGLMTWMAIDTEIQRRQRLKSAQNNNVSFVEKICIDKQWGDYDDGENTIVAYQLFFSRVNYRVPKAVYDRIDVNDKLLFVRIGNEELRIAYPIKEWSFED